MYPDVNRNNILVDGRFDSSDTFARYSILFVLDCLSESTVGFYLYRRFFKWPVLILCRAREIRYVDGAKCARYYRSRFIKSDRTRTRFSCVFPGVSLFYDVSLKYCLMVPSEAFVMIDKRRTMCVSVNAIRNIKLLPQQLEFEYIYYLLERRW